jgi:hypothetical protein
MAATPEPAPTPSRDPNVLRLGVLAGLAAAGLYLCAVCMPCPVQDDFDIWLTSWTWERAVSGLWKPNNEHVMPLGRLLAFAAVRLPGRTAAVPYATALVGPAAVLLGMALVYLFVRRELGHPLYGLLALVGFGVTAVYQEAVRWFAASFAVLALDTLLLGLLAAQRYRLGGGRRWLPASAAAAALAPAWFASGVLAGPLVALYLVAGGSPPGPGSWWRRAGQVALAAAAPVLGTMLFLAVSLPRTAEAVLHTSHYDGRTALESFHPLVGAGYGCRAFADSLLLGQIGLPAPRFDLPGWGPVAGLPIPLVVFVLAAAAAAGAWWLWQAPDRRLPVLGLGMIASSYLLIYSARAEWRYEDMLHWSRYQLQPQLGLTLFVVGGLPGWAGRRWALDPSGRLSRRQVVTVAALTAACFVVQLPRGIAGTYFYSARVSRALREIDDVDRRCRQHHIGAAEAVAALPPLEIPDSAWGGNGWLFLRGSPDPRPADPRNEAGVRRLLTGEP